MIKWSREEWDSLVEKAAMYYVTGEVPSEAEAFRRVNAELPKGRRREVKAIFPSWYPMWGSRWLPAVIHARKELEKKLEMPPVEAPVAAAIAAEVQPETPAVEAAPDFKQQLIDAVLAALETERGQAAIRNAFKVPGGVVVEQPANIKHKQPQAQPQIMRRRKILVVGLLGIQEQAIIKEFGKHFDFKFLDSNSTSKRIRENASNADSVCLMIGFINHSIYNVIKDATKHITHINGTVTDLKRVLTGMVNA